MTLAAHRVVLPYQVRGPGEGRLDVAAAVAGGQDVHHVLGVEHPASCLGVGQAGNRSLCPVADADERGGAFGLLQGLGDDDGHRLAGVVNDVVLHRGETHPGDLKDVPHWLAGQPRQVLVREDPQHAGGVFRRADVDAGDPAARDGAGDEDRTGQPAGVDVGAVVRVPADLDRPVDPVHATPDQPGHRTPAAVWTARTRARRPSSTLKPLYASGSAPASAASAADRSAPASATPAPARARAAA